jgi:hypothetical protein
MLMPHLPETIKRIAAAEALTAICEIRDEDVQAEMLRELAPQLSETLLAKAFEIARQIKDGDSRALALSGLVPHLPETLKRETVAEALADARECKLEFFHARALIWLAPHLPETLKWEAIADSLAAGCRMKWSDGGHILSELTPLLIVWDALNPRAARLAVEKCDPRLSQISGDDFYEFDSLIPYVFPSFRREQENLSGGILRSILEVCRWWP